VQLDIDHIPNPNYLNKTLGYFKDPKVAWVQAPSVYKNLNFWTARGGAEQELVLQGPLQMGFYGHSETPFIIGSHCTYRMSAIKEIGGFQPTRAEDHLDTVYLSAEGYKGVFLPEIIAEGDGPETLSTYLAQQFAWAYSMLQVLIGHSPKLLKKMSWKRRWQFLFSQTWYPVWSFSYLVLFLSPIFALWVGRDILIARPGEMLIHFMPVFIASFLIWWAGRPLMQPKKLTLSWRGMVLHAVRWPIIFRAMIAVVFKVKKPYMITPKGKFAHLAPSLKTYRPFLILGLISAGSVVLAPYFHDGNILEAQTIFGVTNAGFMLTICLIDLILRAKQVRPSWPEIRVQWLKPIAATAGLAFLMLSASLVGLSSARITDVYALMRPQPNVELYSQTVTYEMSTQQLIDQIKLMPEVKKPKDNLGIYSTKEEHMTNSDPYIEHSFADWRDDHYIAYRVAKTLQAGNTPLLTIEPRGESNGATLLSDISSGKYDSRLNNISQIISASKSPVYIRFAHEMELAKLYPWGNQKPEIYKQAFIHVGQIFENPNPEKVFMVWSPAGNQGAEKYYPGDKYVDIIGTTILYDEYWYGSYLPTFSSISSMRDRMKQFNKPVWIVEFGAGRTNAKNQKLIIEDALRSYKSLGFSALIYLDMKDANISGPNYSLSSPNEFINLINQSKNSSNRRQKATATNRGPNTETKNKNSILNDEVFMPLKAKNPIIDLR
jgi:hypothetical protein